jgi:hypothetical protein
VLAAGSDELGDLVLVRLRSDGTLDPSFGAQGIARLHRPWPHDVRAVIRLPGGDVLFGGRFFLDGADRAFAARLHADGTPSSDFGDGGWAMVDTGASGAIDAYALMADGRLVVTGRGDLAGNAIPFVWMVDAVAGTP